MSAKKIAQSSQLPSQVKEQLHNNFVVVAVLVTLVIVVICLIIGKNLVEQFLFNNRVIGKKAAANRQLDENLENIPALLENHHGLGDRANLVMQALPEQSDFPGLASSLELIAGQSGARLKTVSPLDTAGSTATSQSTPTQSSSTQPTAFAVSLAIEGNYDSIKRFLSNIELSVRPMKVTDVKLGGTTTAMTATFELETFYQGPADMSEKTENVK